MVTNYRRRLSEYKIINILWFGYTDFVYIDLGQSQ